MYKNIYLTNYHIWGLRKNCLNMVRTKTNIAPGYKHTKSYEQLEHMTLNISFDRQNQRFSYFFSGIK